RTRAWAPPGCRATADVSSVPGTRQVPALRKVCIGGGTIYRLRTAQKWPIQAQKRPFRAMAHSMLVFYWLEVMQPKEVAMQRKHRGAAGIAVMLSTTVVPALPAWAVEKTPAAIPSEAPPGSTAAGVVKPPVAVPTDDFAPTAELVSVHFDFNS